MLDMLPWTKMSIDHFQNQVGTEITNPGTADPGELRCNAMGQHVF